VSQAVLVLVDCLLALGACLRLTRFIVADDVPGTWWIKWPLDVRKHKSMQKHAQRNDFRPREPWWGKYLEGLSCPFCCSVWFAALVTATLLAAGGPGDAADWWRIPAGFLTLAWLTGHIAAWTGDTE
jgi:hypothetical protein